MRLLSTKILSQDFRDRLLMNQFSLVEQSFIKITPLENPKIDTIFDALIFTSKNAVETVFSSPKIIKMIPPALNKPKPAESGSVPKKLIPIPYRKFKIGLIKLVRFSLST